MKNILFLILITATTGCLSSEDAAPSPVTTDPADLEGAGWVDCRTGGYGQGVCKECGRNGGSASCCESIEAQGLTCEVFCDPGAAVPDKKGIIRRCLW